MDVRSVPNDHLTEDRFKFKKPTDSSHGRQWGAAFPRRGGSAAPAGRLCAGRSRRRACRRAARAGAAVRAGRPGTRVVVPDVVRIEDLTARCPVRVDGVPQMVVGDACGQIEGQRFVGGLVEPDDGFQRPSTVGGGIEPRRALGLQGTRVLGRRQALALPRLTSPVTRSISCAREPLAWRPTVVRA